MHGGSRSGKAGRGVYARRRILAVLLVLLLLALLVPRACQALMGSSDEAGSKGEQKANVAGTDTGIGSGAGNADSDEAGTSDTKAANTNADKAKDESSDDSSSRGAPFLDHEPGTDDASGAGDEAAPDLLALVTPPIIASGNEDLGSEDGESAGAPSPSGTGDETQAGQQPTTEPQNFSIARRVAAEQPSSGEERTPAPRSRRATPAAFEPAATPRVERLRDRRDLRPDTVVVPAAVDEAGASQTTAVPVVTQPATTLPAAATPVAIQNDTSFVPNPAVGVAANSGGNTARGAFGGAGAVGTAPAALRTGPRLASPGPAAARPAIF